MRPLISANPEGGCIITRFPQRRSVLTPNPIKVYRTILSLEFTIGADTKLIAKLGAFRKKRNLGDYSIAGSISKKEADEMVALAQQLRKDVEHWIHANYPQLF